MDMPIASTPKKASGSRAYPGHAAPELAVDEVTEPPRRKAQRDQGSDEIRHLEPSLVASAGEEPQCDQHADKTAMKAHSTLPDRQHFGRMREVIERLVE